MSQMLLIKLFFDYRLIDLVVYVIIHFTLCIPSSSKCERDDVFLARISLAISEAAINLIHLFLYGII